VLAAATLLHREHTCPTGGGTPLLDELDENCHKHAYAVSGDLKYAPCPCGKTQAAPRRAPGHRYA